MLLVNRYQHGQPNVICNLPRIECLETTRCVQSSEHDPMVTPRACADGPLNQLAIALRNCSVPNTTICSPQCHQDSIQQFASSTFTCFSKPLQCAPRELGCPSFLANSRSGALLRRLMMVCRRDTHFLGEILHQVLASSPTSNFGLK